MAVELAQGVQKFLIELSEFVQKTKTIIMTQGAVEITLRHCPVKIDMMPFTKDHAAECLRRVLLLENKFEITKQELLNHRIMDYWAESNFEDTFPFDVARRLNKDVSLDDYTNTLIISK